MSAVAATLPAIAMAMNLCLSSLPTGEPAATGSVSVPARFSLAAPRPDSGTGPPPAADVTTATPLPKLTFHPRPLLAAAEVAGLNLGVWAFLHYVGNAHYSYISWETVRDNIRDGWEWDRSLYFVNFYHHPYHGYLYYSAGRANGLGFWGSSLAAVGGSLMWEYMMEKYRPSINDWITTSCGGIVYGEIGYRFSALVRKSEARGLGRIWREIVGTVLDPVGGVNRLLNGHEDSDPSLPGSPDLGRVLGGELIVTGPVVARSGELTGTKAAPTLGFTIDYGDRAGTGWTGRPFDVFTVRGRLRWGPDRPHLTLFIDGALFGRKSGSADGAQRFLAFYQHYDYYGFETMRVGGTSFTGGWDARIAAARNVSVRTGLRLGWMGLGASDDFLDVDAERRNYNLGTGWTASASAAVAVKGLEYLSVMWRHYGLYNLRVTGSRPGREAWDILLGQVEVPLWSSFGLGFAVEYCGRSYRFHSGESGARRLYEARAFLAWQF